MKAAGGQAVLSELAAAPMSPAGVGPSLLTERERELGAIIAAYNDVTERLKLAHERLSDEVARLREELQQKNAELRRRERLAALGEMAAGLAHEIRNPLGGIALYASMLEGHLTDQPAARTAAVRIAQSVRLLDRLVSEILEFAQEHRLDLRTCELGEVLKEVQDSLGPWAADRGAAVVMAPAAFVVKVRCDPTKLQQVLVNLLMNALQAVDQGGRVWLSAAALDEERGVEIEVCDDGPGIPPEDLERIFNPFFTTRATGTGLGLAIVHRIVESHGGTISAGNRPEGGARFIVRLPPSPDGSRDGGTE